MLLFSLKKFISFWLMPLPFCVTLIVAGACLRPSARLGRLGRRLLAAGVLLLLLFSNQAASTWLAGSLEQRYPAIPELPAGDPLPAGLAACRYVVVLGGGHSDSAGLAAASKLSTSALARLVEGVRLMRRLPEARLIVSGPAAGPRDPSHAAVLAQAAESLGIAPARIRLIETAHDTEDESQAVKAMVGPAPIALVTSAWHMPRAAGLFRRAGVNALPCPTDYRARAAAGFRWTDLSWDTDSLDRSTFAVREYIGYLWVFLRGKV